MEPNQEIMSQKREKEETIELKVPTTESLTTSLCPENCKISSSTTTNAQICSSGSGSIPPEPARTDPDLGHTPPLAPEKTVPATGWRDDLEPNFTKKSVNRCLCCGKRVGLTGFRCRCGELFCTVHRYTDRHDCSYDYKAAGREAIARENPVVRAAKILKV